MLSFRKCHPARECSNVVLDPLTLLPDLLWSVAAGFAFHVVAHDIGKRCTGQSQACRQMVDLAIERVADDETLVDIEHRQAACHVVEGDLEPAVYPLQLLLVLNDLGSICLQGREGTG